MNDTIDKLRRNFATGMTSARISDDEWRDVFLPVIREAERFAWLKCNPVQPWVTFKFATNYPGEPWVLPHNMAPWIDEAIDDAMSATTEESK